MSSTSKDAIAIAVEKMFDSLAYRLLGNIPKLRNKSPFFGSNPENSLAFIFVQALNGKYPNHIERDVLRSILNSSYGYIESLKNKTSSNVVESVDALIKEAKIKGNRVSSSQVNELISVEMDKARNHIKTIAEAETTKTRNIGHTLEITQKASEQGVEDPTVFFITIKDNSTCSECKRLHLMPDGITPRVFKLSEISMGWHKRGDDRPSACGEHPNCFTGSQKLSTDKGLISFKELFDSQIAPKVLVDYRIKNKKDVGNQFGKDVFGTSWLDLHSQKTSEYKQATKVYDTGIQNVIKFTLDSGQEIEVTENHEMWVEIGNTQWRKIEAKNLVLGNKVPLITKGESFGIDHFPEDAELMGNLLGDGHINETTGHAQWNFFGNDLPYGDYLYNLIKKNFPNDRFNDSLTVFLPNEKYSVSRTLFNSTVAGKYFQENYNLNKKPRRVPERLFQADKDTVSAFLRGLYAADGCSQNHTIQLSQNDLGFLKQVQMLFSMYGFVSRIYDHNEAHQSIITYADGTEYLTDRKQCWRLFLGGSEQCRRFLNEIGFGVPFKQKRGLDNLPQDSKIRSYWRTAKIVKIEKLGLEQTYCITEPNSGTVCVNGVVTGQCRCSLSMLPLGSGFKGGYVTFISQNHDEYKSQRNEE